MECEHSVGTPLGAPQTPGESHPGAGAKGSHLMVSIPHREPPCLFRCESSGDSAPKVGAGDQDRIAEPSWTPHPPLDKQRSPRVPGGRSCPRVTVVGAVLGLGLASRLPARAPSRPAGLPTPSSTGNSSRGGGPSKTPPPTLPILTLASYVIWSQVRPSLLEQ